MAGLSFEPSAFRAEPFSAGGWIAKQRETASLGDLHADLSIHARSLHEQLRAAMCTDFPQFVALSSDISSMEAELSSLCEQLGSRKEYLTHDAHASRERLTQYEAAMQEREAVEQQLEDLHLLRRLVEALNNAEALLTPAADGDELDAADPASRAAEEASRLLSASGEYRRIVILAQRTTHSTARDESERRGDAILQSLLSQLLPALADSMAAGRLAVVADLLQAYVEAGSSEVADEWLCSQWIEPRLLPRLESAAAAEDPLPELVASVNKMLQGDELAPLTQPAVVALPLNVLSSVWAKVCQFATSRMGAAFGAGIPQTFHAAYLAFTGLQAQFEALMPSPQARRVLRNHVATVELTRKFNLPIYFQLRVQEISKKLDAALPSAGTPISMHLQEAGQTQLFIADLCPPQLLTQPAVVLAEAVTRCFSPSVFLRPLASRFLRLAFQTVGRFTAFLQQLVGQLSADLDPPQECFAADAAALQLHLDLSLLVEWLSTSFESELGSLLALPHAHELRTECAAAWREGVDALRASNEALFVALVRQHAQVCAAPLKQVRGIPALYRMTGKPHPTAPSSFVSQVFEPLAPMLPTVERARADVRSLWARGVAEAVTSEYVSLTVGTLEKVANDEKALRRHIASKRGGATAEAEADSDKIRSQLCLDVNAYGVQLAGLGVVPQTLAQFDELQEAVNPAAVSANENVDSLDEVPLKVQASAEGASSADDAAL